MRYELKLDFKRMETVKAEKGYQGPVVVCALYFVPVAGYIPDRPVIKYLAAQRNIEIAFAPIAGTRILVPFWLKVPTPLGPACWKPPASSPRPQPPQSGEDAVSRIRAVDPRRSRCAHQPTARFARNRMSMPYVIAIRGVAIRMRSRQFGRCADAVA